MTDVRASPSTPVDAAIELRRRVVREVLLDPFGWVGIAVISAVLIGWGRDVAPGLVSQGAALSAALLIVFGAAFRTADTLLFASVENDFLRTQPLGERGLLRVRRAELSWWMAPLRLLAAAFGFGIGGGVPALLAAAAIGLLLPAALRAAITARRTLGAGATRVGFVPILLGFGALGTPPVDVSWPAPALYALPAILTGIAFLYGRGLEATWDRAYEQAASAAAVAPPPRLGGLWPRLEKLLPLPRAIRARLVRDAVLLLRGWDPRAALLLLLSPLAAWYLVGELDEPLGRSAVWWRVLQAAALGGAAVAYAVGPTVHVLRNRAMVWERASRGPGRRASLAAHLYAAVFAVLHSALVLGAAGLAGDGRHTEHLVPLVPAVLLLEAAMAHYAVAYSMTRTAGRRIAGEATLAFTLPIVAVAVAGGAMVHPALGVVYFVVTAGMFDTGTRRYEDVEVTW